MPDVTPEFEWYDAWVLAAVIYSSEGAAPIPLWRIVGIADALNKAIISRDELELALEHLVRAGYVTVSEGVEATPAALGLKAPGPPLGNIARAIGAKPWTPQTRMPRTVNETYVSADAYRKAVTKYRKEFWRECGKTRAP